MVDWLCFGSIAPLTAALMHKDIAEFYYRKYSLLKTKRAPELRISLVFVFPEIRLEL